jgi:pimeloyl-ACP methyl ester carboxylesterase
VNELHTLLVNAGITGPYVLVGHSFGGINVRLYAIEHPEEVAGMVLVDASNENQYERFAALMPPAEREEYLQHESGNNCERVDLPASAAQVRSAGLMPDLPLTVLSAGGRSESHDSPVNTKLVEAQKDMQNGLAGLTPNSTHIIVEESGHFIQLDRPDVVVNAIRSVVEGVRKLAVQPQTASLALPLR